MRRFIALFWLALAGALVGCGSSPLALTCGTRTGRDAACASEPAIASPGLLTLGGGLRELLIDACHAHVYVSNDMGNRIEDVSVAAGAVQAPIPVGSSPEGFDITPDGARLYVANRG